MIWCAVFGKGVVHVIGTVVSTPAPRSGVPVIKIWDWLRVLQAARAKLSPSLAKVAIASLA